MLLSAVSSLLEYTFFVYSYIYVYMCISVDVYTGAVGGGGCELQAGLAQRVQPLQARGSVGAGHVPQVQCTHARVDTLLFLFLFFSPSGDLFGISHFGCSFPNKFGWI